MKLTAARFLPMVVTVVSDRDRSVDVVARKWQTPLARVDGRATTTKLNF